jgi:hypothetical protein
VFGSKQCSKLDYRIDVSLVSFSLKVRRVPTGAQQSGIEIYQDIVLQTLGVSDVAAWSNHVKWCLYFARNMPTCTVMYCWVGSSLLLLPRLAIGDIPAAQAMDSFHSRQPVRCRSHGVGPDVGRLGCAGCTCVDEGPVNAAPTPAMRVRGAG